jgi:hypothetical protein
MRGTKDAQPDSHPVTHMESNGYLDDSAFATRVRRVLLDLARREDDLAHEEAAAAPYWAPPTASVIGHRAAASSLRSEADRFLPSSVGHAA